MAQRFRERGQGQSQHGTTREDSSDRICSLPISQIPALPSQQQISSAQTVEDTYKIYQTPLGMQTQPQHNILSKAANQDNVSSNVCRPKIGKPRKMSLSRFDDKKKGYRSKNYNRTVKDDPDVIDVFTYLVKHMKGIATPSEIVDQTRLFTNGDDVTAWFKSYSSMFTIFEKPDKIIKIAVYVKDATYCWNYNSKRSCDNSDCLRYHICRDLLSGNCRFGDRCRLSHDCLDKKNKPVSHQLGFTDTFLNDDIINILSVRQPRICESWNQNAFCSDECCIQLHMYPSYILGHCEEGPNSLFGRSKNSDHNSMVIKAYRMVNISDHLLKMHVYVTRHPEIALQGKRLCGDKSHSVFEILRLSMLFFEI